MPPASAKRGTARVRSAPELSVASSMQPPQPDWPPDASMPPLLPPRVRAPVASMQNVPPKPPGSPGKNPVLPRARSGPVAPLLPRTWPPAATSISPPSLPSPFASATRRGPPLGVGGGAVDHDVRPAEGDVAVGEDAEGATAARRDAGQPRPGEVDHVRAGKDGEAAGPEREGDRAAVRVPVPGCLERAIEADG